MSSQVLGFSRRDSSADMALTYEVLPAPPGCSIFLRVYMTLA